MEKNFANGSQPRTSWESTTLFLITLGIFVVCLLMLRPFLPGIMGAIVLAVVTRRPQHWLRGKIGNRTCTAAVALFLVTLSIVVPGLLLLQNIGQHILRLTRMWQNGNAQHGLQMFLDRYPQITLTLQNSSQFLALSQAAEKTSALVASRIIALLSNSVVGLAQTIIMLFLLFFLYRDEELALHFLYRLLPLGTAEIRYLVVRIGNTIRAIILGRFIVAGMQGLVAGAVFASLGIYAASILGVLTALAAIVPSFGAYVIWLPVAIFLAISGHWIKMTILFTIGTLIISTLDNFVYPVLVGAQLRLHTVSVFLSLLGGIWLFGFAGLVLGPVIFSVAGSLLMIWRHKLNREPLKNSLSADSQSGDTGF
ncbi:MAG: AI-2E family transporter [Acidobacteriaceae bacterium]